MTPDEIDAKLKRYLQFLQQDPANIDLLCATVDLCLAARQHDEALRLLETGLTAHPDEASLLHRRGLLALRLGQADAARTAFAALVEAGHDAPALRYNLAYANYQSGDYAAARELLQPLLEFAAELPAAPHLLILSLHQLGELEEAIALALEWSASRPDDAELAGMLSLLYLDDDQLEASEQWSERALALAPEQPFALIAAGSADLAREAPQQAIARFDKVLARDPNAGRAWSGLGLARLFLFELPAAREALDRAVALIPEHVGTWHARAWVQMLQGDVAGAEASFQAAMDRDRNFGETHGGMAIVAALQGQDERADAALARAKRLMPAGFSARYVELLRAQQQGDHAGAQRILSEALASLRLPSGKSAADLVQQLMARMAR
ncbi:tetratricopeptide repeat protein [Chitinimonas lacunae]|uniref:Tetratricopeptide repeat protein n=1 Tax=Chitinimonas lacunae TaxID=1963018 RepID=A0ABV8MV08_9NEIS